MRLCACGCGLETEKYFDKNGVWKTYLKYIKGHRPRKKVTPAMLDALKRGREKIWKDPAHRAKMSILSSAKMRETNARRAAGEFGLMSQEERDKRSARTAEMWRNGTMRPKMAIRADGFRSGLERNFADYLTANGLEWQYEPRAFDLVVDGEIRSYAPDFYIPSFDWWIETKGFFWDQDAKIRVQLFLEQYPNLKYSVLDAKLAVLFGRSWQKLSVPWAPYSITNHITSPLVDKDGNEILVKRHFHHKTHCKRGHEFKEGSYKILSRNRRECLICVGIRYAMLGRTPRYSTKPLGRKFSM